MTRTRRSAGDPVPALRALAHRTRFAIVKTLAGEGELSCGAIVARFPLRQPTISHHLKLLADAGLVQVRRKGQRALFSLNWATFAALARRLVPTRG